MRRSQENELAQMPQPVMSIESAIIAGASSAGPPMLCPIMTSSSSGAGHSATSICSKSAKARPFGGGQVLDLLEIECREAAYFSWHDRRRFSFR